MAAARARLRISVIDRYLEPDEVGGLFQAADLVAMPYAKLCRSPILDLAAAFRKPVLRSARVEATQFEEGLHGLTVEHGDSTAFAATLACLAREPRHLQAMRRALAYGPDFTAETALLAATHSDIYDRTLADRADRIDRRYPVRAAGRPVVAGE
jgi:hypothetical protein